MIRPLPAEQLPQAAADWGTWVEPLRDPAHPGHRRALAKAITLTESTRPDHRRAADALLTHVMPFTGHAFRLGLSGVPGVGKSTFIETLGLQLVGQGHRVAVLTVDPSSLISGGSILGDKTRMERLSVHPAAYIRPSPSSGALGGVAERTRETLLLCEAAGYDVVLVETVGVGQSETAVAGMTDLFVLLQLPNAGDDLQAIKKGVMERADLVLINKADLDPDAATRAQAQITSAMRLMGLHGRHRRAGDAADGHPTRGGASGDEAGLRVMPVSALKESGVAEFWRRATWLRETWQTDGRLAQRRQEQALMWMHERIQSGLLGLFRQTPQVAEQLALLEQAVRDGEVPASVAARQLLGLFAPPGKPATGTPA